MFTALPASHAAAAARLTAQGWRPAAARGQLQRSPAVDLDRMHLVDAFTWQAMCLQQLQRVGLHAEVCAGIVRRPGLPPTFGPGTGWYKPGQCAPGSLVERHEMRAAAVACTVVVMYRRGVRVPPAELLGPEPPSGLLVCMDRYTQPNWHACLFTGDGEMRKELLPRLMHARLEREHDGVRLYGGIEFEDRGREEYRQAWLCTPTPGRARDILLEMLERQVGPL